MAAGSHIGFVKKSNFKLFSPQSAKRVIKLHIFLMKLAKHNFESLLTKKKCLSKFKMAAVRHFEKHKNSVFKLCFNTQT